MKNTNNVMKKLNDKIRVLKDSNLFDFKELNKRSAISGGYSSYGFKGVRSEVSDDYLLILNIKGMDENIAVAINYSDRTEEETVITVSKADNKLVDDVYRTFKVSENVCYSPNMSYQEFSEKLRLFNRELPFLKKDNIVSVFSKMMNIEDPNNMSEEEKEAKKVQARSKLKPLVEQKRVLVEANSALFIKRDKANKKANKKFSEMDEVKELKELEEKLKALRVVVDKARTEIFEPVKQIQNELQTNNHDIDLLDEKIESEKTVIRKGFVNKDFDELVSSL